MSDIHFQFVSLLNPRYLTENFSEIEKNNLTKSKDVFKMLVVQACNFVQLSSSLKLPITFTPGFSFL